MIFSLNIIQFRIMERKKLLNIMFASQKRSSFANYFQNLHFMSYEHFPLFTMKVLNNKFIPKGWIEYILRKISNILQVFKARRA